LQTTVVTRGNGDQGEKVCTNGHTQAHRAHNRRHTLYWATGDCYSRQKGVSYNMNANAFRQFYDYHFSENRKIWDLYVTQLSHEQFTQQVSYSHGSVRDQIVHLMNVDEGWFNELQGVESEEPSPPAGLDDRESIRARWASIEQSMRAYLAQLQDDMLFAKPIREPEEDANLIVWQVLLHVANHGTDHRAQLLRLLNDLGIETKSQDYIFYVYDHQ
jgi:uncharacterized damage-inducible protein DinB